MRTPSITRGSHSSRWWSSRNLLRARASTFTVIRTNKHSLRDAIVFFGRAVDDPSLVKLYTNDAQSMSFGSGSFATFAFYAPRFGAEGLPPAIVNALKAPTTATRLGGCTTILAAK